MTYGLTGYVPMALRNILTHDNSCSPVQQFNWLISAIAVNDKFRQMMIMCSMNKMCNMLYTVDIVTKLHKHTQNGQMKDSV